MLVVGVAIGVVVVGAMVIVWAGIAFEEKLVEQWYLWKLDSAGEEEQERLKNCVTKRRVSQRFRVRGEQRKRRRVGRRTDPVKPV